MTLAPILCAYDILYFFQPPACLVAKPFFYDSTKSNFAYSGIKDREGEMYLKNCIYLLFQQKTAEGHRTSDHSKSPYIAQWICTERELYFLQLFHGLCAYV